MTTDPNERVVESPEPDGDERSFFLRGALIGLFGGAIVALVVITAGGSVLALVDDVLGTETTIAAPADQPADEPATGDAALVAAGEQLANNTGCVACHSTDGSVLVGPSWAGLSARADEAYVRESILDPGAVIVDGFDDLMPKTYADLLSTEDLDALVAYLQSL